jgi:hypothetical protein
LQLLPGHPIQIAVLADQDLPEGWAEVEHFLPYEVADDFILFGEGWDSLVLIRIVVTFVVEA